MKNRKNLFQDEGEGAFFFRKYPRGLPPLFTKREASRGS